MADQQRSIIVRALMLIIVALVLGLIVLFFLSSKNGVSALYYMRIPILGSVLLVFLPFLAMYWKVARPLLRNLFVLTTSFQIASVIVAAIIYGNAVSLIFGISWKTGAERFAYEASGTFHKFGSFIESTPLGGDFGVYITSLLLALPIIITALWRTHREKDDHNNPKILKGVILGIATYALIGLMSYLVHDWFEGLFNKYQIKAQSNY